MYCDCGGQTMVMETREVNNIIYRRRKCLVCNKHIYTKEDRVSDNDGKRGLNQYQRMRKGYSSNE